MSIDIFGRQLREVKGIQGPPGVGFQLTTAGDYDVKAKRICHLANPKDASDAVTLSTLQNEIKSFQQLKSLNKNVSNLQIIVNNMHKKIKDIEASLAAINKKLGLTSISQPSNE